MPRGNICIGPNVNIKNNHPGTITGLLSHHLRLMELMNMKAQTQLSWLLTVLSDPSAHTLPHSLETPYPFSLRILTENSTPLSYSESAYSLYSKTVNKKQIIGQSDDMANSQAPPWHVFTQRYITAIWYQKRHQPPPWTTWRGHLKPLIMEL